MRMFLSISTKIKLHFSVLMDQNNKIEWIKVFLEFVRKVSIVYTLKYFDQIKSSMTKIRRTPTHRMGLHAHATNSSQPRAVIYLLYQRGWRFVTFCWKCDKKNTCGAVLGSGGVAVLVLPKIFDIRLEHYLHAQYV